MTIKKLEFNSPVDAESVFYEAFMHCDWQVMAGLWAGGDVVCVHPGSGIIRGYEKIMRSWTYIFDNAKPPKVNFSVIQRTLRDALAIHVVAEEISAEGDGKAQILSTNVYQKFDMGWLMIEHHASLVNQQAAPLKH